MIIGVEHIQEELRTVGCPKEVESSLFCLHFSGWTYGSRNLIATLVQGDHKKSGELKGSHIHRKKVDNRIINRSQQESSQVKESQL